MASRDELIKAYIKSKKILDLRCFCDTCKSRTEDIYHLSAKCINCGWTGIATLRKGDKPPTYKECPHCGCSFTLCYGNDPLFEDENPKKTLDT